MKLPIPNIRVVPNPVDVDEGFLEIGGMITLRVLKYRDSIDGRLISAKVYHNDCYIARAVNKVEDGDNEWWVMDGIKNAAADNLWAALVLGFAISGVQHLEHCQE